MRTLVASLPFVIGAALAAGALGVAACSELRVANVGDGGVTANGDGDGDGGGDGDEAGNLDGGTPSSFTIVQQVPDGGSLSSVFGFAGNDIHAVGENGTFSTRTVGRGTRPAPPPARSWRRSGEERRTTSTRSASSQRPRAASSCTTTAPAGSRSANSPTVSPRSGAPRTSCSSPVSTERSTRRPPPRTGTSSSRSRRTRSRPEPSVHPDDAFAPVVDALWGNDATHFGAACDLDTTVFYRDPNMWVPEYDPINRKRRFRSIWGPPGSSYNFFIGANYNGVWLVQNRRPGSHHELARYE